MWQGLGDLIGEGEGHYNVDCVEVDPVPGQNGGDVNGDGHVGSCQVVVRVQGVVGAVFFS